MKRAESETQDDPAPGHTLDLISPHELREAGPDDAAEYTSTSARWRRLRWLAYGVYFAVLTFMIVRRGVPTGRTALATMVISGLLLTTIGRNWRRSVQVIVDWLPFTAVLLLYDRTRGIADTLGIRLHEKDILDAEEWLFGGQLPTVWLQHHLYDPAHVYWYDALCTLVYTSHFLSTPILAAILWLRDRAAWLRYISRVVLLAISGLITYCFFPEAPPWFAAKDGLTDPIARLSARGWIWLHANNVNDLLENAQKGGSNPVAAMPSLHTAFAVLTAITIGSRLWTRWRWLLALYPAAMGFTLVYCGEHYVLDLVFGVIYALVVHYAVRAWEHRRDGRRDARRDGRRNAMSVL